MDLYYFVEEQIKKAVEKGEFDNLPGMGKPQKFTDDLPGMPQEIKMAYKVLKQAGYLDETDAKKEKITFSDLYRCATDGQEEQKFDRYMKFEQFVQKRKLHKNPSFRKYARKIYSKLF